MITQVVSEHSQHIDAHIFWNDSSNMGFQYAYVDMSLDLQLDMYACSSKGADIPTHGCLSTPV
jgi:hypothetical protein